MTDPTCALCGNPTSTKCGACESTTYSRYYCSKDCQVKDWPDHKTECKEHQILYLEKPLKRIAEIVQQAYYDFRMNTWDTPITRVVEGDSVLILQDELLRDEEKFFVKFPGHLTESERTKKTMLCSWIYKETTAWMYNLILGLVKGLDVKLEEATVDLGTISRMVTAFTPVGDRHDNWPDYFHNVLFVSSTKPKKKWVIDMAGAQYGIYNAFWDWTDYKTYYGVKVQAAYPFGTNRDLLKERAKARGNPFMTFGVVGIVAAQLDVAIEKWVESRGMSLAQMIALDEDAYEEAKKSLLESMDSAVSSYVATNDFDAEFKAAKDYERMNPGRSGIECQAIDAVFYKGR